MYKIVNLSLWKDINKSAIETKELSIQVLEQLEKQEEQIKNTDKNLNHSMSSLNNSNKILNNMSWFGWFMGFIPFKSFFSNLLTRNKKEEKLFIENIDIKYNYEIDYNKNEYNNNYSITSYNSNENKNENDIEILKLENELNDLLWIGTKIGEHLDLQNNYLDNISSKTEILFDKTKQSTKKTTNFL